MLPFTGDAQSTELYPMHRELINKLLPGQIRPDPEYSRKHVPIQTLTAFSLIYLRNGVLYLCFTCGQTANFTALLAINALMRVKNGLPFFATPPARQLFGMVIAYCQSRPIYIDWHEAAMLRGSLRSFKTSAICS
jgi:hypothetical protein